MTQGDTPVPTDATDAPTVDAGPVPLPRRSTNPQAKAPATNATASHAGAMRKRIVADAEAPTGCGTTASLALASRPTGATAS